MGVSGRADLNQFGEGAATPQPDFPPLAESLEKMICLFTGFCLCSKIKASIAAVSQRLKCSVAVPALVASGGAGEDEVVGGHV